MKRNNKKTNAKTFALQKRKRRQWLTFLRMCRYGVNNFSRNAWLTIAATAVMTLTLFVVMVSVGARNILQDSVTQIRDKVDMSIYVQNDTTDEDADKIASSIRRLSSVRDVNYISPSEARKQYARDNESQPETLEALNNATNVLPGTFRVGVVDINDPSELRQFTENNELLQENLSPDHEPSFDSTRREAIDNIARWTNFADRLGILASAVLVIISSLIVFNTIRMAIFNRQEEIKMMKLIGADKGFIRGPFVVEAVVYGFIAAIIATGLAVATLYGVREKLHSIGIAVEPTVDFVTTYVGLVLLGMILIGALIGVISSLLATRKYLKI